MCQLEAKRNPGVDYRMSPSQTPRSRRVTNRRQQIGHNMRVSSSGLVVMIFLLIDGENCGLTSLQSSSSTRHTNDLFGFSRRLVQQAGKCRQLVLCTHYQRCSLIYSESGKMAASGSTVVKCREAQTNWWTSLLQFA